MGEKELNFNINYNELIIRDNKLIVDVSVRNDSTCEDTFIDSIYIDNKDTYSVTGGPSPNAYTYTVVEEYDDLYTLPDPCNNVKTDGDYKDCKVSNFGKRKNIRLELNVEDFKDANINTDIENDIFFVYVTTKTSTSTGALESTIGIAYNKSKLFNMSMPYIKELNCRCEVPRGFIDYILRLKAFEFSLKAGNYTQAIFYWNEFFNKPNNCKCNGTIS